MNWETAFGVVVNHLVRIETPQGYGTGFLAFRSSNGAIVGIATAAHVISHASDWDAPIKLTAMTGMVKLHHHQRILHMDESSDSAIIMLNSSSLDLPETPLALQAINEPCATGADVGWIGFPNIEPFVPCFFSGRISARIETQGRYYIDGVAVNGVSGGPVFHLPNQDATGVKIIGAVSSYHPNIQPGAVLPGLSQAVDVSHFHSVADEVRSIEEGLKVAEPVAGTAPSSTTSGTR